VNASSCQPAGRVFSATSQSTAADVRSRTVSLFADYNKPSPSPGPRCAFNALAGERIHDHPVLYNFGWPIARLRMACAPHELMQVSDEWWR